MEGCLASGGMIVMKREGGRDRLPHPQPGEANASLLPDQPCSPAFWLLSEAYNHATELIHTTHLAEVFSARQNAHQKPPKLMAPP